MKRSPRMSSHALALAALALASCQTTHPRPAASGSASAGSAAAPSAKKPPPPPPPHLDALKRDAFNRLAPVLDLPLFWVADANHDGTIQPDEIAVLWGIGRSQRADWVSGKRFSPRFSRAYRRMVAVNKNGYLAATLSPAEKTRRQLVLDDLGQGRQTLVRWDFRNGSAADRAIVKHVLRAALLIERIYARQKGVDGMQSRIPADDPASRMLFFRNRGPWCVAPKTESNPACCALPQRPKKIFGIYPAALQKDKHFCSKLGKRDDGEQLLYQFAVVRARGDKLVPVPYTKAYADLARPISAELKAAAAAITSKDEAAFKAYLLAAAQAFLDNGWGRADEAWAKMNAVNSHWYLRIGPDEVYWEPCNRKAGFHVSFARINQGSLSWQKKLEPVKNEMERVLARYAGRPYRARKVSFHLPDFIDIVLNAGDSRSPHGATIGQSLPNWGKVVKEGRGRTVAMVNLYADADSRAQLEKQAQSLLCKATMAHYSSELRPMIMSTVLHEASHNLGPAHEYKVHGKKASQIFGGPLASTFEELKAQTAAMFFADWLVKKKKIDKTLAEQAHVRDVTWMFGHISRGMYNASGKPKSYSQLAAIQFGYLVKTRAIEYKPSELAANGKDKGCYELHLAKFPRSIRKLTRTVARIKARGDKPGALRLKARYVDAKGKTKANLDRIAERWLRAPKASFVYSVRF